MAFHIEIGNYRLSKTLGIGSFGKVKLAFHKVTGHTVAVKVLNKNRLKQQNVMDKLKREIRTTREFNHPHIIKHFEFINISSDIFIINEYASGGELFEFIQRHDRLDEKLARKFMHQIISGLEYIQQFKMSHRDLKPENLLVDENQNIKIIDFGLTNNLKDGIALRTPCGSPNYAAPEVISGKSYSGCEVDIWSCGVILYAMVCGSLPFDDEHFPKLYKAIKQGKYHMPNFISPEVQDLINRMLQPNPIKRIKINEIKDHPWFLVDLPLHIINQTYTLSSNLEVDMDIVAQIMPLEMSNQGLSQAQVIKAIQDHKNCDFCAVYELMLHNKQKKEFLQLQNQSEQQRQPQGMRSQALLGQRQKRRLCLLKKKQRLLKQEPYKDEFNSEHTKFSEKPRQVSMGSFEEFPGEQKNVLQPFVGFLFKGDPAIIVELCCIVLQENKCEWEFINKKAMKLKVRTEIPERPPLRTASQEEKDRVFYEFMAKEFLKFQINILKSSKQSDDWHQLDIQQIKGCPCNFMTLAGKIQRQAQELYKQKE